jgi:hypothetical protein
MNCANTFAPSVHGLYSWIGTSCEHIPSVKHVSAYQFLTIKSLLFFGWFRNDPRNKDPQTGKAVLWSSIRQTSGYKERSAPYVMAIATSRPEKKTAFTPETPICEYNIQFDFGFHVLMQWSFSRRIYAWRIRCMASLSQRFDPNGLPWLCPRDL